MAIPPKEGKLIYHLTAIDNLKDIFRNGLRPRNQIGKFIDIADEEIIGHREKEELNNLIPFHFFAPSPFHGNVQKFYPDKKFVYITVLRGFAKANDFKILIKHPLSLEDCIPIRYELGMGQIDWGTMAKRDYTDHECKEICLAECLTDKIILPKDFFSIYVKSEEDKKIVETLRNETIGEDSTFYINVLNTIFVK